MDNTETLKGDLSNMMSCLEQVKSVSLPEMSPREIYDIPRGVQATPKAGSPISPSQKEEAQSVWDNMLRPNTVQKGSHEYFVVVTKADREKN